MTEPTALTWEKPEDDPTMSEKTLDEIRYECWVKVHTPGQLSKDVVFAALTEAYDLGRAEERKAMKEHLLKLQDEILDLALGFATHEPGDPRTYYQREAAGVRSAISALDAREESDRG